MKKIEIKEPCHENWADFTPTQRGAFCGSCQINVIDFSQKSNSEIRLILSENAGKKMCGRFTNKQLDELNHDYYVWENQNSNTFKSKFVLALVMVFGLTLFSCSDQSDEHVLGEIQTELINEIQIEDTLKSTETQLAKDSIITKQCETPVNNSNTTETIDHNYEELMVVGEIEPPEEIEIMGDFVMPEEFEHVKGKVAIPPHNNENEFLNNNQTETVKLTDKFEINLYQNKDSDQLKMKLNVLSSENYVIELKNDEGNILKEIDKNKLKSGIYNYEIDLTSYSTGIYWLNIKTDTQDEVMKLVKN